MTTLLIEIVYHELFNMFCNVVLPGVMWRCWIHTLLQSSVISGRILKALERTTYAMVQRSACTLFLVRRSVEV